MGITFDLPSWKVLGRGPDAGAIGTVHDGPGIQASDENLAVARRHFDEIRERDLDVVDGHLVDLGSGRIWEVVGFNPLLVNEPEASGVTLFTVAGDRVQFLRGTGRTVDDLEAEKVARAEAEVSYGLRRGKYLARQRQAPILFFEVEGPELPTVKEAARRIFEHGGRVGRDEFGNVTVSAPVNLFEDDAVRLGAAFEVRRDLVRCARVLVAAERIVVDALERNGKQPLHELLPDRPVGIGGALA